MLSLPWYKQLIWFGGGFVVALGAALLCQTPPPEPIVGTVYDEAAAVLAEVEVYCFPLTPPADYDPSLYTAESGPDGRFLIHLLEELFPARLLLRLGGHQPTEVVVVEPGNLSVVLRSNIFEESENGFE